MVSGITSKLISETQKNRDLSNLSVSAKIYTGIKNQQGLSFSGFHIEFANHLKARVTPPLE